MKMTSPRMRRPLLAADAAADSQLSGAMRNVAATTDGAENGRNLAKRDHVADLSRSSALLERGFGR